MGDFYFQITTHLYERKTENCLNLFWIERIRFFEF